MGRLIDAGLILDNLSGRIESMKDYDAVKDVMRKKEILLTKIMRIMLKNIIWT